MAIDTAEKRKSVSGIERLLPGVTSNALADQEWRQQSGWGYSGILAGNFIPTIESPYIPTYRRRRR